MKRDQNSTSEIVLRLTLEQPTAGVDFALQKGRGSAFTTEQSQRSSGRDLKFEIPVVVKTGQDGVPDFSGPYVQGSAGQRFFYINIGTYAGQTNTPWGRRLKVPLYVISWSAVRSGRTLTASIPGAGKGGGPSCAYERRKRVDSNWGWEPVK
jgi:hypothetical protein